MWNPGIHCVRVKQRKHFCRWCTLMWLEVLINRLSGCGNMDGHQLDRAAPGQSDVLTFVKGKSFARLSRKCGPSSERKLCLLVSSGKVVYQNSIFGLVYCFWTLIAIRTRSIFHLQLARKPGPVFQVGLL